MLLVMFEAQLGYLGCLITITGLVRNSDNGRLLTQPLFMLPTPSLLAVVHCMMTSFQMLCDGPTLDPLGLASEDAVASSYHYLSTFQHFAVQFIKI